MLGGGPGHPPATAKDEHRQWPRPQPIQLPFQEGQGPHPSFGDPAKYFALRWKAFAKIREAQMQIKMRKFATRREYVWKFGLFKRYGLTILSKKGEDPEPDRTRWPEMTRACYQEVYQADDQEVGQVKDLLTEMLLAAKENTQVIHIGEQDFLGTIRGLEPGKVAGMDGLLGSVVRCLGRVDLGSNSDLSESHRFFVTQRLPSLTLAELNNDGPCSSEYTRHSSVNFLPQVPRSSEFNELRPIALILILVRIKSRVLLHQARPFSSLEFLQFANQKN